MKMPEVSFSDVATEIPSVIGSGEPLGGLGGLWLHPSPSPRSAASS